MNRIPTPGTSAGLAGAAAVLAGCGGSTPTVSRADLEAEISRQLAAEVGAAPDRVDCPDGLHGEVGATQRCTLTAGADTLGVDVEVTAVDGTDVSFDIEVDDQVQG